MGARDEGADSVAETEERLKDALLGNIPIDELLPFERSALRIHIYFRASEILDMSQSDMKRAGESLPDDIRDLVREECKRLLRYSGSDKML